MAPQISLYRVNGSCSMASHILLTELGIPFKSIRMARGPDGYEGADGSLSHEQYVKKIHAMGYVPALVVDDEGTITENPAIFSYIANLDPERALLGRTTFETAKATEWLVWLSGTLHNCGYGAVWRPKRFSDDEKAFDAIKAKGMNVILYCYRRIEETIQGQHAIGYQLTVVDIFLHTFWRWGFRINIEMAAQFPRYAELARNVEKLESVKSIMADEGEALTFPVGAGGSKA